MAVLLSVASHWQYGPTVPQLNYVRPVVGLLLLRLAVRLFIGLKGVANAVKWLLTVVGGIRRLPFFIPWPSLEQ